MKTTKAVKQTARNNAKLRRAKKQWNGPTYRKLLHHMNNGGNRACAEYLKPFFKPEYRAGVEQDWLGEEK